MWVKESSLSPKPVSPTVGDIEVEQYSDAGFALRIVGGEGRCTAIMRMTKENCREMIKKFVDVLWDRSIERSANKASAGSRRNLKGQKKMFMDRSDAGRKMAQALLNYRGEDIVILAIPRGGVVVAYEVATMLKAPLVPVIAHKLSPPGQPELGIGAVAQDWIIVLDSEMVHRLQVPAGHLVNEIGLKIGEVAYGIGKYRVNQYATEIRGKVAIIVDDGIASGFTMIAAIHYVRKMKPSAIVVATPIGKSEAVKRLREEVDDVVCLSVPKRFSAVSLYYHDFSEISDEEVIGILEKLKAFYGTSHV